MNSLKENSSSESNSLYSNSYIYDTDLSFATSNAYENEFKIETSLSISHSAPTSLAIDADLFTYQQYTPNIDYIQCLPSTDDSIGSSCSSGTKLSFSHPQTQPMTSITHQISSPSFIQSNLRNLQSGDSYYTSDISGNLLKSNDINKNDAITNHSNKDGSRSCRGRGRSSSNISTRKRHLNQQNNDETNPTNPIPPAPYGRGKHGKALARNPFIPSYMDPNTGPHLCVVCKHNASGFHYRVMACEGCKGFFRRTVQNNLKYTCKFNNNCIIQPHNRAQCQECRWRKCLVVGMAKDLVLSEEARRAKKELIAANRAKKLIGDKSKDSTNNSEQSSDGDCYKNSFYMSDEDERNINRVKLAFEETDLQTIENSTNFQNTNHSQVVQCIIDYHVTSLIMKCDIIDDSNIQAAKFNYSETFSFLSIIVEPILRKVISFAFMLPNFLELTINDQIILLKNACFDIICLRNAVNFDKKTQSLHLPTGYIISKNDVKLYKLIEPTYVLARRISKLNMDTTEISLMAALALICCDRLGLQDYTKVENLQDGILKSIDSYMKHNSFDNTHRQSELYATILPELRTTTSWHQQIVIQSIDSIFSDQSAAILKDIYSFTESSYIGKHIQSSESMYRPTTSPNKLNLSMNTNPPDLAQCHIYSADLKYPHYSYISQPMPCATYSRTTKINSISPPSVSGPVSASASSSIATGVMGNPSANMYRSSNSSLTGSHLPNNSGQSSSSSFTELLIESSPAELKPNKLYVADNFSQESSIHANYTPVTNHSNLITHDSLDPVFEFSTNLI